jgi:hypothetical protein
VGGSGVSLRRLGGDRAGEVGLNRFFHNEAVTSEEMLRTARGRTAARCAGLSHVLVIQDTTVLRGEKTGGGLYLHAAIAVDVATKALLGPVHGEFLSRTTGERGQKRARTVDDKESRRWLTGADMAAQVCAGAARITVAADRESDIYEAFARRPKRVELLIRAAQDRALADGGSSFAAADALPELARRDLDVPAAPGRPARKAVMALRLARLKLKRPRNGKPGAGTPESVEITLVDVREVEPPAGQKPLHWRLLTTHEAVTAVQGWEIADLYRQRWHIEQVFRTFKTDGFDIERAQVESDLVREKLAAVCFIAAVAVQQMVHARDGAPPGVDPRPLEDAFEADDIPLIEAFCTQLEGKTERQKNPHPRGTLAYAAWVCARLGGWTGYYGKPGPIVMLRGWRDIQAAKAGWTLALINPGLGNV